MQTEEERLNTEYNRLIKAHDVMEWDGSIKIPDDAPPSWLGRRKISSKVAVEYFIRVGKTSWNPYPNSIQSKKIMPSISGPC